MKDWVAISKANGLDIPARDLDRVAPPLAALEETFRPLVQTLTPEIEPAFCFHMEDAE